jgi:electron transfer flavoprotein alpha subunit
LGAYGADTVYLVDDDRLAHYETERYTAIVANLIRRSQPFAVLFPSTPNGRDLAPRVAARLQVGLTGDCVGLELDAEGRLVQLKPAFGGNIVAPIYSSTMPQMATVRPGMLDPVEPDWSVSPQIVPLAVPRDVEPRARLLQAVADPCLHAIDLQDAEVIVSVGMGVGGPENIPVVRELARVLDAPISSSLRVVSIGWLPYQLQIGLTGKAVAPRFYIAVGISGQANHLMGVKKAAHIIAINNNPEAPIFKACNFGIVGDWAQIVPALTRALEAAKARASA